MTVRAMKAGAFEFLTKPFKDDVLLDALRHAIERSRAALKQESEMQVLRSRYASLTPRGPMYRRGKAIRGTIAPLVRRRRPSEVPSCWAIPVARHASALGRRPVTTRRNAVG
jgi:DNA-binding NtrC family response regulator